MAHDRPHLRIERFFAPHDYARPSGGGGGRRTYGRAFEQHAEALKQEIASAWASADALIAVRDAPVGEPGSYLAFETAVDAPSPTLDWKRQGIRLAAARRDEEGRVEGALFVPDAAREFLTDKVTAYGALVEKGRQRNESRFAPIDRFAAARLETLWVDRRPQPAGAEPSWWECWCWPDRVANFVSKAIALELSVSDERLRFHEREVVFVYATRSALARLVSSTDAVAELRSGRDTAAAFMSSPRADQDGWIQSMVDKLVDARGEQAPAVCLLDTGVNRGHPLLSPFLKAGDRHAVRPEWDVDDHDGHGTELAGLALYGDLTAPVQAVAPVPVVVGLESVKLLPPNGFPANGPGSFGLVTLQAVARPEIAQPDRPRVFCLAIGQEGVSGPRASSWSAAVDQAAYGDEEELERRRRLFVVAAGNIPDGLKLADLEDRDEYEVEDPAQAWNALAVGGVTEKAEIVEEGYEGWSAAAAVDELSPYSKVSAAWSRSVSAVKPELVMEAGNRSVDPADETLWSGLDSLSLLTTGRDPINEPLSTTWATSAAAAQVAGLAGRLMAAHPQLWPETVRALLVHSATWTPPMRQLLRQAAQKGDRIKLARRFGYGRPNLARAEASAAASLALVSEAPIQPYRHTRDGVRLNKLHLYQLPWPRAGLAALAERDVRLRVTLSYFIDPNPSADAPLAPARYRSFGLRFDLRKKGETVAAFTRRLNEAADAIDEDAPDLAEDDAARLFGPKSVSAGSLHVEEWTCSGADLIERDTLAVFPVGGWWKNARGKSVHNREARYSLIVTVDAGDAEVDLYAEVASVIATRVAAEAAVPVQAEVGV